MVESKPPRFFRTPRAKPGPARVALDSALDGRDLAGMDGITAAIAQDAADLVDSARKRDDPKLWLSASARLLALVSQLERSSGTVPDDGRGVPAEPDDPDGLASAVGTGATLGDAEEP